MQAIPYKTTPEVFTALRAGDIQAGIDFIAPVMGQIKGGVVKVLGVTGSQGKGPNQYGEAHYIALDAQEEIYIADTLNWRVQKLVKK